MSARDVIARALFETDRSDIRTADWSDQYESVRNKFREQADRLTAAGYRILGPDELDPVTVERCARTAAGTPWYVKTSPDHIRARTSEEYAAEIRSLGDGR